MEASVRILEQVWRVRFLIVLLVIGISLLHDGPTHLHLSQHDINTVICRKQGILPGHICFITSIPQERKRVARDEVRSGIVELVLGGLLTAGSGYLLYRRWRRLVHMQAYVDPEQVP
jgi:hypothetical protein